MINQKYTMSTVLTFLLLIGGYFVVLSTGSVSVSVHNEQSKQEVRVSSGSSIHTKTNTSSNWGDSPFATGKTTSVAKTPAIKPRVNIPNLEWKTRTVTLKDGRKVTYEFGKGNPKEVALSLDDIKAARARCGTNEDPLNEGPFCKEYDGYVSKEVEEHILAALSDPNWDKLLTECREQLTEEISSYGKDATYSDVFNHAFDSDIRSIDNFISINLNNGRKELNLIKVMGLRDLLRHSTFAVRNMYNDTKPYKNPTCVDTYGKRIMYNFDAALSYFVNPGEVF